MASLTRLTKRAAFAVALAGGLTFGASSMAAAAEIISIDDDRQCVPVCKVADAHYTDWQKCDDL